MFQSLELLLLSLFFLTVEPQQDQVLPPRNVSLVWHNGFQAALSWEPSQPNCTYTGSTEKSERSTYETHVYRSNPWYEYFTLEGGFLKVTLQAICNGKSSEEVVCSVSHPELVNNLQCYMYAATQAYCSWSPASPALDHKFFYRILPEDFTVSQQDEPSPVEIIECQSYNFTNGVRTGCNLEVDYNREIHVLFNGTLNEDPVWNTFKRRTNQVRLPPLRWKVDDTYDKLSISWIPPVIKGLWKFTINYTECEETRSLTKGFPHGNTSWVLDRVPHCPYRIRIRAAKGEDGGTEWSEEKYFAARTDPAAWVYAAIIIPLLFAGLAVLIIVCCRKNKDVIFPKVPEPRDFLSDISDNNNKIAVRNLYIPSEEEESCKITLVHEP